MKIIRVTIGDIVLVLASCAALGALWPFAMGHPLFMSIKTVDVSDDIVRLANRPAALPPRNGAQTREVKDAEPFKIQDSPAFKRPLFTATRRPPPPAKTPVRRKTPPPPKPKRPPSFKLLGVLTLGAEQVVILSDGPKTLRMRLKEQSDGWTLTKIGEAGLRMAKDGATITVDRKGSRFLDK